MANTKITELTAVTALAGTDVFPVVDVSADTTNKVSVEDLLRNAPDGTAGAPSIANAGDQDTGILFPAANSVGVSTGGTQRLVIDSSGQVGIGTTTVNNLNKLHLQAASASLPSTSNQSVLLVENSNNTWITIGSPASNYSGILFADPDDADVGQVRYNHNGNSLEFITNAQERLRIDSSGRLLINTSSSLATNSSAKLHVAHSGGAEISIGRDDSAVSDGNDIGKIRFYGNDGGSYQKCAEIICEADGTHAADNKPSRLTFSTCADGSATATERMRIDSSGNVGIGTSSPSQKLHVSSGSVKTSNGYFFGSTESYLYENANDAVSLRIGSNGPYIEFTDVGSNVAELGNASGELALTAAGAEKVRIKGNGNVGIGTTSPSTSFHVNGSGNQYITVTSSNTQKTGIQFGNNTDPDAGGIRYNTGDNSFRIRTNNAEAIRIDSSGNVGIGTALPSEELEVQAATNATIRIDNEDDSTATLVFHNTGSTDRQISVNSGSMRFGGSSDEQMRIDSSGRLLIGTTTGDGQLEVRNSNGIISRSPFTQATDTNKGLRVRNNSDTDTFSVSYKGQGYFAGNVGIGTSSPSAVLHTAGTRDYTGTAPSGNSYDNNFQSGTAVVSIGQSNGCPSIQGHGAGTAFNLALAPNAGKVGIGTSSPSSLLHLSASSPRIEFTDTDTNVDHRINCDSSVGNFILETDINNNSATSSFIVKVSQSEKLRITNSGRVGIGTSSPSYPLVVQDATLASASVRTTGKGELRLISATDASGHALRFGGDSGGSTEPRILRFLTSGDSERMRIDKDGRLLVGTSSAIASANNSGGNVLCLNGSQTFFRGSSDTNSQYIEFVKQRSGGTIVSNGDKLGQILFEGHDGSNPIKAAQITAEVDGTPGTNDMPGRLVFSTTADGASSPTERMRISNNGDVRLNTGGGNVNVGTGTTDGVTFYSPSNPSAGAFQTSTNGGPAAYLRRRTSDGTIIDFRRDTTAVGTISVTTTATAYNTSSDYRLKENVVDIADGITRVKQLQPRRFNFIANADRTVDGFIAHEAQTVVPEAVTGTHNEVDDDGNAVMQGIDQSKLVPLLTAALQEAIAKIETLETKVAALEAQ